MVRAFFASQNQKQRADPLIQKFVPETKTNATSSFAAISECRIAMSTFFLWPGRRTYLFVRLRRDILTMGKFIIEPGVLAMEFQEALVGAVFNYPAMIKHQYLMCPDDGT